MELQIALLKGQEARTSCKLEYPRVVSIAEKGSCLLDLKDVTCVRLLQFILILPVNRGFVFSFLLLSVVTAISCFN